MIKININKKILQGVPEKSIWQDFPGNLSLLRFLNLIVMLIVDIMIQRLRNLGENETARKVLLITFIWDENQQEYGYLYVMILFMNIRKSRIAIYFPILSE